LKNIRTFLGLRMTKILPYEQAVHLFSLMSEYYDGFENIEKYLWESKAEKMQDYKSSLPGTSMGDMFFQDWSIHPKDFKISIHVSRPEMFDQSLELVTSHAIQHSIPGRSMRVQVMEETTGTSLGFIRLGSPVINLKPRNNWLEQPLSTKNVKMMRRFNDSSMMGFIIVPTQPFGFNYLGGKLLAAICCSHEIKTMVDNKYNMNLCHFETTSLYGTTKSISQYDGMKPFLRYKGNTESDFLPMINGVYWNRLLDQAETYYGEELVPQGVTSRKMKQQQKIVSLIVASVKKHAVSSDAFKVHSMHISGAFDRWKGLTEKKRVYFSDYGYSNVKEYLTMQTDKLEEKKEVFARHSMKNVIEWWKNKAGTRYEKLIKSESLRTKLELWNENPEEIDIIR